MQLSENAQNRRLEDIEEVAGANTFDYARIILIGLELLVLFMARKLTPAQRAAVVIVILAVGSLATAAAAMAKQWVLVLFIGILLGFLISETRRL